MTVVAATVAAGVAIVAVQSQWAAAQTAKGCTAGVVFQALAAQPGETLRLSVVAGIPPTEGDIPPTEGDIPPTPNRVPVWGVRVLDAGGKVVQDMEISAPSSEGIATGIIAPDKEVIPPTPSRQFADLAVQVSLRNADAVGCVSPVAGLQGFDKHGATTLTLTGIPPTPMREIPPTESAQ